MSSVIGIVQRVVERELGAHRGGQLGVVTAVTTHTSEDDDQDYAVDVRLKHDDLVLRRVPLAVDHVGLAAPPRIDDLVLVQFLDGDLNQPLVTGRFYHASTRPPLCRENEVLLEHRVPDGTLNHLRFAPDGSILLQRDVTSPADGSKAKTTVRIDGSSGDIRIDAGAKVIVEIGQDGKLALTCDDMSIKGNVQIDGTLKVASPSGSTTIAGNKITGGLG